jgi:hypothetical protein
MSRLSSTNFSKPMMTCCLFQIGRRRMHFLSSNRYLHPDYKRCFTYRTWEGLYANCIAGDSKHEFERFLTAARGRHVTG